MGWHKSPPGWILELRARDRLGSAKPRVSYYGRRTKQAVIGLARRVRKCSGRLLKKIRTLDPKMQPAPKISVVMAVFNGERYLPDAVESILHQSFRDFEFRNSQ